MLLDSLEEMLGHLPLRCDVLEVRPVLATDALQLQGERMAQRLDEGDGVLMLTDAYGSTPSNIASRLCGPRRRVVAGINLPMLVRVFNYPALDLEALTCAAVEGGQRGIKRYEPEVEDAEPVERRKGA